MQRIRLPVILLFFAQTQCAKAAEPTLPQLFPANTLAYAEVRDLAAIAEAWAKIVAGTPLDGSITAAAERRDRATEMKNLLAIPQLGMLGTFAAPEFRAELKKLRGAAVGLTGFDERCQPQIAAVLLTGESTMAGLVARSFLISSPDSRRVATVNGTPIFQHRPPSNITFTPEGKPIPFPREPAKPDIGPAYAYLPGLFVVASDVKGVEGVLSRFGLKEKESLAETARYQAAPREEGALFALVDPAKLFAAYEKVAVKTGDAEPDLIAWLRFAVIPSAIKSCAWHGNVTSNGWSIRSQVELHPGVISPMLELCTNAPAVSIAGPGLTIALPEKPQRVKAILATLDAAARAAGVAGRFPSDIVKRAEQNSGLNWTRDLLPGVASASLDPGTRAHREAMPVLILAIEGSVDPWDAAWPGLFQAIDPSDKPVSPSKEVISGVAVQSFALSSGPASAVHIARDGNRIALGTSRPAVVRAVKAERTESIRGSVARIPPEWLVPTLSSKPEAVRIPFLPPPTLIDVLSPFPEIRFAATRPKTNQVNFDIVHNRWSDESVKTAAGRFSQWLEGQFAGELLGPERLEGGILK